MSLDNLCGEFPMPVDVAKIAQLELALEQAKAELQRENGKRYEIIMREISPEEKQRILDGLTDRRERILFDLEASETKGRAAKSGGDLVCPICQKPGLTEKGLKLHNTRMHAAPIVEVGTGKRGGEKIT